MERDIELTNAEIIARDHLKKLILEGSKEPCDDEISIRDDGLPVWYDENLYKRGQEYFQQNRMPILFSNYMGLISFLAEPRGIDILKFTGRSETPEAAQQRYVSILVHTLSWYDYDLTPGSESLKSLKKVRRLHYLASKATESKGIPGIRQGEMASTAFGFMGFVLARPEQICVKPPSDEERDGFVHLWAVVCYMVGVKDKYNICLLPVDALIIYCQMMIRYILLPLIQINNKDFEIFTNAIVMGLKPHLYEVDFDADMFYVKRLLLVPGYQFNLDHKTEVLCRSILNQQDVDELNQFMNDHFGNEEGFHFTVDIPIIEVEKCVGNKPHVDYDYQNMPYLKRMNLKPDERIMVRMVNYEKEWQSYLNNSKFYELSLMKKLIVLKRDALYSIYKIWPVNYMIEFLATKLITNLKNVNKILKIAINSSNKWLNDV